MRQCLVIVAAIVGVTLLGATAQADTSLPAKTLNPNDYQSFVVNWSPDAKPLCAVMLSQADWDKVMHPAPVMGGAKPFSPVNFDWNKDEILLIARVINGGGDNSKVFSLTGVTTSAKGLNLAYGFKPTPAASYTIKGSMLVVVPRAAKSPVRFVENGKATCALDPAKGKWVSPKLP
jgi:hypothetical protein